MNEDLFALGTFALQKVTDAAEAEGCRSDFEQQGVEAFTDRPDPVDAAAPEVLDEDDREGAFEVLVGCESPDLEWFELRWTTAAQAGCRRVRSPGR